MTETQTDPWGTRGRAALWVQALAAAALLAFVLIGLNLLARRFYVRKDLTTERTFELDDATVQRLRALPCDVTIYLVVPGPEAAGDRCVVSVWQKLQILCDEFQRRSPRVKHVLVSEANPTGLEDLRRHFEAPVTNSIYFVGETAPGRFAKKAMTVAPGSFYDGDPTTGKLDNFFGERWMLAGLVAVTTDRRQVVYSVIGHEEATISSGLAMLARFLDEREGIELRPLPLKEAADVPADADAVLLAAPQVPLDAREIDVLKAYLARGGSLFIATVPDSRADLNPFLKEYGVEVRRGVVLDPAENYRGDRRWLRIQRFGEHEVNRGMQNVNMSFILPFASVVGPLAKPPAGCTVTPILFAGPNAWEETGPLTQAWPKPDANELRSTLSDPLPLGVAVSAALRGPAREGRRDARLVVWGSAAALFDYNFVLLGRTNFTNLEYILNQFRWLMGREELIAIPPKRPGQRPMDLSPSALDKIKWVTILGFPVLGVIVGALAWFVRRK
ncbi:MAG: Gldg family protein [Planctomycetes bacterium]|nr:Gldg family protein [Planctomycetota bacterium]